MTSAENFFGGPPTYSFADDLRMGKWCGGIVAEEPFKQQRTNMDDNQPEYWDAEKQRPKMQLVLQIDSHLGAVPERVDQNDDGMRRLFVGDSGDLNKAVKAALAQHGVRSIQRGCTLYVCNTGMRPAKRKGARDARTFQAAYQPPTPQILAALDAKRPQHSGGAGEFFGAAQVAPAQQPAPPAPFAGQPSAAPWQPQAAPVAPPAAPPVFQPTAVAEQPAQVPAYAPAPGSPIGSQPLVQQVPTQAPPLAQVGTPAAPEQYPGQLAAQQTPPWAQPGYVPGQTPAPAAAVPPNPFQPQA
jgi:hypothetical protein